MKRVAQASLLPHQLQHRVMNDWLYRQFGQVASDGGLQFLRGRFLLVHIDEINFELCLTLGSSAPVVIDNNMPSDAIISGRLESFLLLAEQAVDSDMLFFQRQLSVEGDTNITAEVKKLLHRVEWLPESKQLAQKLHAMQRAFNFWPTAISSHF